MFLSPERKCGSELLMAGCLIGLGKIVLKSRHILGAGLLLMIILCKLGELVIVAVSLNIVPDIQEADSSH